MIGCALVWIDKWFQVVDVAQLEIIARQATATQIIIKPNSFIHCTNTDIYEFTQRRHYLCCRHNTSLLFFEQFSYLLKSIMFRFKYGNAFMAKINGNIAPGLRLCKVFLCRTSFFFASLCHALFRCFARYSYCYSLIIIFFFVMFCFQYTVQCTSQFHNYSENKTFSINRVEEEKHEI